MRPVWIALACAVLAGAAAAAPAPAAPKDPRLRTVETWALPLGEGARANVLRRPGAFDLVVDGEETTAAQVRRLRRHGAIVLGYLSVGTIESYRWWHGAASLVLVWLGRPGQAVAIQAVVAGLALAVSFPGTLLVGVWVAPLVFLTVCPLGIALTRRIASQAVGEGGYSFYRAAF